ncbi:sigma-70 family RNA polymerase sigma factor [Streptomyces lydicus]
MASADARQLRKTFLPRLLSLVRYAARRFTRRGQPVDDILQVGTIGLIKAIDRWRPSRDVEFTTLAVPCIQGEIKRFFRDTTWAVRVPRRLQEMRIEIARAREQLEADGVQEPSAAQSAGRIGADEGEVTEGLPGGRPFRAHRIHHRTPRLRRPGPRARRERAGPQTAPGQTERPRTHLAPAALRSGDDPSPKSAKSWAFPACMSPACWPACAAACANNFSPRRSGNSAGDTSARGPAVSSTGLPHAGVGVADGVCT